MSPRQLALVLLAAPHGAVALLLCKPCPPARGSATRPATGGTARMSLISEDGLINDDGFEGLISEDGLILDDRTAEYDYDVVWPIVLADMQATSPPPAEAANAVKVEEVKESPSDAKVKQVNEAKEAASTAKVEEVNEVASVEKAKKEVKEATSAAKVERDPVATPEAVEEKKPLVDERVVKETVSDVLASTLMVLNAFFGIAGFLSEGALAIVSSLFAIVSSVSLRSPPASAQVETPPQTANQTAASLDAAKEVPRATTQTDEVGEKKPKGVAEREPVEATEPVEDTATETVEEVLEESGSSEPALAEPVPEPEPQKAEATRELAVPQGKMLSASGNASTIPTPALEKVTDAVAWTLVRVDSVVSLADKAAAIFRPPNATDSSSRAQPGTEASQWTRFEQQDDDVRVLTVAAVVLLAVTGFNPFSGPPMPPSPPAPPVQREASMRQPARTEGAAVRGQAEILETGQKVVEGAGFGLGAATAFRSARPVAPDAQVVATKNVKSTAALKPEGQKGDSIRKGKNEAPVVKEEGKKNAIAERESKKAVLLDKGNGMKKVPAVTDERKKEAPGMKDEGKRKFTPKGAAVADNGDKKMQGDGKKREAAGNPESEKRGAEATVGAAPKERTKKLPATAAEREARAAQRAAAREAAKRERAEKQAAKLAANKIVVVDRKQLREREAQARRVVQLKQASATEARKQQQPRRPPAGIVGRGSSGYETIEMAQKKAVEAAKQEAKAAAEKAKKAERLARAKAKEQAARVDKISSVK